MTIDRTCYPALSLTQPWASLMCDGRKHVETRSWRAPAWLLNRRFAIHAAKSIDKEACRTFGYDPDRVPRGIILCTLVLDACLPTPCNPEAIKYVWGKLFDLDEIKYGNFDDGRFAWLTSRVQKIEPPLEAKGHLGLWNVMLPSRLEVTA